MTVNCRSIVNKKAELAACMNYIKPDIMCGTKSWLKGEQPGKPTKSDAIRSSQCFPENYEVLRNDRGTVAGGVFIATKQGLFTTECADFLTNCEI